MIDSENPRSKPLASNLRAQNDWPEEAIDELRGSQYAVRGVCPVIETPFASDGEADGASLEALVRHLGSAGVSWVMYPGFASEHLKLTDIERDELTELVIEHAHARGMQAVASVSDHGTLASCRRAQRFAGMGADAVNILPPYQLSPDSRSVVGHLEAVMSCVAETPIVVQVAPALTGSRLDAASLGRVAADHRNFLQVKVESVPPGRTIADLKKLAPTLSTIVGYAGLQLPDALRRGAIAVQPGSSFAELYVSMWDRWHSGPRTEALHLHARMIPYLSYWMQDVELIVAAEKRISLLRGIIATDVCRQPGWTLDAEERKSIDSFLQEFEAELMSPEPRERQP